MSPARSHKSSGETLRIEPKRNEKEVNIEAAGKADDDYGEGERAVQHHGHGHVARQPAARAELLDAYGPQRWLRHKGHRRREDVGGKSDGDAEQGNVRERVGDEREAPQDDKDAKRGRQNAHERTAGKRPHHELVLED